MHIPDWKSQGKRQEMELEKFTDLRYNRAIKKIGSQFLGCSTLLFILNLHFDTRDSNIFKRMSGLLRVEGRCLSEVAHLAMLGVNYTGTGILGLRKIKAARNRCFLFSPFLFYKSMIWYR